MRSYIKNPGVLWAQKELGSLLLGNLFEFVVGHNGNIHASICLAATHSFVVGQGLGFAITYNAEASGINISTF